MKLLPGAARGRTTVRAAVTPLAAAAALLLASCATLGPGTALLPPVGGGPVWRPLAPGVETVDLGDPSLPLAAWGVRVDLSTPGLRLVSTPDNGNRPGETDGLRTSTFAQERRLLVCVNGSPFRPEAFVEGRPMDISGLYVYRGRVVSEEAPRFPALLVYPPEGSRASWRVVFADPPALKPGAELPLYALGGFRVLLRKGENRGLDGDREARTAIGTSPDGRTLYFLVVDGRSRIRSVGLSSAETADWLRYLGATEGILMDGGGSTTLVLPDPRGRPALVNSPRDRLGIEREQVVANHFGVGVGEAPGTE